MKIAYVSDSLSIHDYRFLKKLSESEHKVWLITYHSEEEIPANIQRLPNIETIHKRLHSKCDPRRYNDKHIMGLLCWHAFYRCYMSVAKYWGKTGQDTCENWISSNKKMLAMYAASTNFGRYQLYHHFTETLKKIKPDLVHAGWVQTSGLQAALSGFHPFLLMPWGSDILIKPDTSWEDFAKAKYTIKKADMITCDCESVKKRIIEIADYPPHKIIVFPWGIDLNLFQPQLEGTDIREKLGWSKNKLLIMTRSFAPVYGIEYFLKALPRVVEEEPEARVILIGSGPLEQELRNMVAELGISEYVHFAGYIPNEEMPKYLNAADIYVSSSLSDGTSLCLLEAMACRLPVVVTDVPSYFEWIQDGVNGFIVPRKDSKALADKIVALFRDEQIATQMGEQNLQIAWERANWDKNFAKLEEMYHSLV